MNFSSYSEKQVRVIVNKQVCIRLITASKCPYRPLNALLWEPVRSRCSVSAAL